MYFVAYDYQIIAVNEKLGTYIDQTKLMIWPCNW